MNRTVATLLVASCLVPGCGSADPVLPITKPPPITGGTLTITAEGLAVAADTDRDVVWLVDLRTRDVKQVALASGDQPGRVVVDAAGRAHVVLRGSGDVARIDARAATLVDRRRVCPAPRGIAYDAGSDVVHVVCEGGELVTLPAAGGAAVRSVRLDRDLRDVVVEGDHLLVSHFRSAELWVVTGAGGVVQRQSPLPTTDMQNQSVTSTPTVAWRTLALPAGGVAMVHQMATATTVGTDSGAYGWGSPCSGPVVGSTVTFFDGDGSLSNQSPMPTLSAVLPVDVAADQSGNLAVVSAGDMTLSFPGTRASLEQAASTYGCSSLASPGDGSGIPLGATPTAVVPWNGHWLVQTREQAQLLEVGTGGVVSRIDLGGAGVLSDGSAVFHTSWNGVACASCHPEGREDGHTWSFDVTGARRTQTLTGGVTHRAPFHWAGELPTLQAVVDEVLVKRMGGNTIGGPAVGSLSRWLDSLPAPPASPTGTPAQIEHGRQLFQDPFVGCSGCHAGEYLTSNQRRDVGTGASFQVASLVGLSAHAPFLHDGCASTLADRFDPSLASCNGGDLHGHTSQLDSGAVGDLIAYLETL